jgi:Peptidase family M50
VSFGSWGFKSLRPHLKDALRAADSSSEMVHSSLESFAQWMDRGGPNAIGPGVVVFFVVFPLLTLVHELGHAAVGLVQTEGLVQIRVGRAPRRIRGRVGRLAFELSLLPAGGKVMGTAQTFARLSRNEQVAYALAGPAAEALFVALLLPALQLTTGLVHDALLCGWALAMLHALLNLIPAQLGRHRSDGAMLVAVLRSRPTDPRLAASAESSADAFMREFEATQSRWLALFTDERNSVRNERRARLVSGAPVALGLLPVEPGTPGATAAWYAFAGWCWRECERGDYPDRLRQDVLGVWRVAAQGGLVGMDLIVCAARRLAEDGAELWLASPGRTDAERKGFLARAFDKLRPVGQAPLDAERRLFAFRYGIALHDVEAIAEAPRIASVA